MLEIKKYLINNLLTRKNVEFINVFSIIDKHQECLPLISIKTHEPNVKHFSWVSFFRNVEGELT